MTFVHTLLSFLSRSMSFLGDFFGKLLSFLAYPLGWLIAFLDGIWYFLTVLFRIVVAVITIFVALFQFLGAMAFGFLRTIRSFLWVDFGSTPINYPSSSYTGLKLVSDVLGPTGLMTVVPMVLLAILWLLFVLRVFALFSDGGDVDA
ncbi:hypothetical protein A8L34_29560 [Bacillus sp. FJAT-27264]|uniref:hypothetical protein n=1 Tax=Paenibacillus sp. (strain DSM 101736 / FJAT-27264) TaxID=1850362 RepID=UPI00080812D8|nr:hypothetical protein [Bacillus sp. FJAT-27264]OBZ15207.1 hypothetical protein A8L34_29560 [Bacillus sp. FJAT-27264]